jgi:hypothetical protein
MKNAFFIKKTKLTENDFRKNSTLPYEEQIEVFKVRDLLKLNPEYVTFQHEGVKSRGIIQKEKIAEEQKTK